jgi:hypothetical protein
MTVIYPELFPNMQVGVITCVTVFANVPSELTEEPF